MLYSYHVECDPFLTTTSALINQSLTARVHAITHLQRDDEEEVVVQLLVDPEQIIPAIYLHNQQV